MEVKLLRQGSVPAGYKQTEVGVIPADWEVTEIGTLKPFVTSGSRGWASYYSDRGSLFVRITNLSRDTIYLNLKDSKFVDLPPDANEGIRTQLQKHDVLISITADIGIVGYIDSRVPTPAYINQHIALVRFDPTKTSGKFVSYFLASEKPQKLFRASTDVGAKAGMSLLTVQKLQVALPPDSEQRAIAEALSDADVLIESLEQLLAKKRQVKQGAMQELLTGQKRLPGFEVKLGYKQTEVGLIPEDWRIQPIEQISTVGRGRVISHREIARSLNPRYPVYSSQTSNNGVMGYLDTFEFEGEYITWTTDGANAGTVFARNGRFNCTNVCGTIKLKSDNYLFVAKLLGTIAPRHVSRHLGNPKLMNDVMKRVKIPLPPTKTEQEAIAAVLSDIEAEIAALEAKLAKARQLKQGMMQELLTGRIRLV